MVKEYTHTVNVIHEVKPLRPDFAVLSGFEDQILPGLLAGSDGAISGLSNVAPEPFVNLVRSAREGGLRTAAELHRRVLSLMALAAYSDPPIGP
jgi:dihydrodipicolinate synthase/N-acetylneuraminate lyase